MDLTNRDIAFLIWLTVVAVVVLTRRGGREAIAGILGALWGKLAVLLIAYAVYVALLVAAAYQLGFWNVGLLKDTITWFAVPGLVLLFGFTKAYEEHRHYGRTLLRVIGLTAIIEFYVNVTAFPLWVELILLPLVVLLTAMSAVAGLRSETQPAKRLVDRLTGIVGLLVIIGTAVNVAREWDDLDKSELALSFVLPIWLTILTLPFIFLFSLYANYETIFVRVNLASMNDKSGRRRAKAALLASYHVRNRELHRFAGRGPEELAKATTWGEARRIIAFHRAHARVDEAQKDLKAKRLARYAGVEETDWEGRPLDQREFEETREALDHLAMYHRAQHKNGRYRTDILTMVGGLLSKTFPESEIEMTIGLKGRSWFAWRRTVGGWCFGIGAAGAPPDVWTWDQPEPPARSPGPGTNWMHRSFDDSEE